MCSTKNFVGGPLVLGYTGERLSLRYIVDRLLTIVPSVHNSLLLQSRWSRRRVPSQSYHLLYPRLSDPCEFLFRGEGRTKAPVDLRWSHHGGVRHRHRCDRHGGVIV
jgi:hypothetical protein